MGCHLRTILVISAYCLLFGLSTRTLYQVSHSPPFAYADQTDFSRITSWFGIQAERDTSCHDKEVVGFPTNRFVKSNSNDSPRHQYGVITSALLVVLPSLTLSNIFSHLQGNETPAVNLQTVGIAYALLFIALNGIFLKTGLRTIPAITLLALSFSLLFLTDPLNILYFNTFYTYPAAFLGVIACGGAYTLFMVRDSKTPRKNWFSFGLLALLVGC